MKSDVSKYEFIDTMATPEHGFSYEGAEALYDYLTELERDLNTEFDFDPIAIRCDYSEYTSAAAAAEDYGEASETEIDALNYLEHNTLVLQFDGGVIIQVF